MYRPFVLSADPYHNNGAVAIQLVDGVPQRGIIGNGDAGSSGGEVEYVVRVSNNHDDLSISLARTYGYAHLTVTTAEGGSWSSEHAVADGESNTTMRMRTAMLSPPSSPAIVTRVPCNQI